MKKALLIGFMCIATSQMINAQSFTLIQKGDIATDTTNSHGASFVDIDNDGDLDVFLTNANNPFGFNTIYENRGNDNFVKIDGGEVTGMQTVSFGHTWGDFDNDGLPDLFVANAYTRIGSLLYRNMGNFRFSRVEGYNSTNRPVLAFDAAWADYDNDGLLDIITIHPANFVGLPATGNLLFKNNGNNTFNNVIVGMPFSFVTAPYTVGTWSDYDMDGDMDLFIGSGPANGTTAPDYHFQNQLKETGNAVFSRIRNTSFAQDQMDGQTWNWIDYDNDEDLDVFMTNYNGGTGGMANNLYRTEPDTNIRVLEGDLVTDADVSLANVWADFDNDGDLDVIVGNGNTVNKYYTNNGDGTFKRVDYDWLAIPGAKPTWGITYGDYDNDGDIDLLITNQTGYAVAGPSGGDVNYLYRNDLDNKNNWIVIKTVGVESNKSGVGAKVKLTAKIDGKSVTQLREIGSNNTFLGDNDIRAHFGLKNATSIDRIEIIWPSGKLDVFENIEINKMYTATEGQANME